LSGVPRRSHEQAQGRRVACERQTRRQTQGQQKQTQTKNAEGEGMIYERGNSLWYKFRFRLKNDDGSRENFMIRRPAKVRNRKDARDVEREHRRALSLGLVHPNDPWPKPVAVALPVLFSSFAKEALQHIRTQKKPGTHTFYETCLKRILNFAAIADAPLDAITGEVVSRYARYRQEVAKNSVVTVNGDMRTLRRIFSLAIEWGKLDRAPVIHELTQPKGRDRVISFTDEAVYLAKSSENLRDATILAVDAGPRPDSELLTLKWTDVELKPSAECPNGVIHLRFEGIDGKSDNAPRSVPLTPRAAEVLMRRRKNAEAKQSTSPYVFPGSGKSGHVVSLQHVHEKALEESGIRPFAYYCWRHTFGTRAAQSGMDRFTLARLMGHSSPSVTARYYIHVTETHVAAGFGKFVEYQTRNVVQGLAEVFPRATEAVQ
jgi:integrase